VHVEFPDGVVLLWRLKHVGPLKYRPQKKQTYFFFDFECTQDDRIQCQQGYQSDDNETCIHCKSQRCGAFEHKPNLCVVHKVCLKCMDQGVDKDSISNTTSGYFDMHVLGTIGYNCWCHTVLVQIRWYGQ
jgi:hypothetical protein